MRQGTAYLFFVSSNGGMSGTLFEKQDGEYESMPIIGLNDGASGDSLFGSDKSEFGGALLTYFGGVGGFLSIKD